MVELVTTLSLSEAQTRLAELVDKVATAHERIEITKDGREPVILMAAGELESIEATLELLADPEAQEEIRRAEAEIASGHVLNEQQVRDQVLKRRQLHPR